MKVVFVAADGESRSTVEAGEEADLLELGQRAGMPLEGACEGQMACSTCHVIIDPEWFDRLPPASDSEEDMLDLAAGARRTSRLSCQIMLTDALDGLVVHMPGESRNMQGL